MTRNLPDWLVLCVWRALLGEVYPSIRAIAIALSEERVLTIRYYVDREPDDTDQESLEVLATNISASTGLDKVASIELDCQFSMVPFSKIDFLDGFIYCRREYDL